MPHDLAFIGAGNMAEAIIRGLLRAPAQPTIIATARTPERLARLERELHVATTVDNRAAVASARVIVLAVKPHMMHDVVTHLADAVPADALVISVAAGLSCAFFEKRLPAGTRVVRAMPNTPMLVGLGAVGLVRGRHATDADVARTREIFESAALVIELPEDKIDALTALSGSGPAYCFYVLEHLTAGGIALGLSPADADALAKRTMLGAATMATHSTDAPAVLRQRVTSPNGTTQAAITSFDRDAVGEAIRRAMAAAQARSKEMSRELDR